MVKTKLQANQQGIAHLGFILLLVAVIGLGGVAYFRVKDASDSSTQTSSSQQQPAMSEDEMAAADEGSLGSDDKAADQASIDTAVTDGGADNDAQ